MDQIIHIQLYLYQESNGTVCGYIRIIQLKKYIVFPTLRLGSRTTLDNTFNPIFKNIINLFRFAFLLESHSYSNSTVISIMSRLTVFVAETDNSSRRLRVLFVSSMSIFFFAVLLRLFISNSIC